jgi:octaprenyl-diphosphate synthase
VGSNRAFFDQFNKHFDRINEEIKRCFQTRISIIDDVGKHSLSGEGKRLRPLLFVLSCELCGYQKQDIYRLSTIFEYIHTASLLHDDVIDNAETRRNKPSASFVWGNSAAVLTGDFLSSLCSSIAIGANNLDFLRVLINTGKKMSEGQALELFHTKDWNMTKEDYMEIIISKTASLMSAACMSAGIISSLDDEKIENLSRFGLNLGIAFQLIDDLLDYTSTEDQVGKPVGKDLREGKVTLPLIYAFSNADGTKRDRIRNLFTSNQSSNEEYHDIILDVRSSDAIERVRSEAIGFTEKATDYLKVFEASSARHELLALNQFLVDRTY